MENTGSSRAQIGCGSLIVIAIIVMFFSGSSNTRELRKEVGELHTKIDRLEQKLDAMSRALPPTAMPPTPAPAARP